MAKVENACCMFNITLFKKYTDKKGMSFEHEDKQVIGIIDSISKKYAMQLEKGKESGHEHYQINVDLQTKKRRTTFYNELKKEFSNLRLSQISNTSILGKKGKQAFDYCMKEDTRIRGPWTDQDRPPILSEDIKELISKADFKLYPWQEQCKKILSYPKGDRTCHCIIDLAGHGGKSVFRKLMFFQKIAFTLQVSTEYGGISKFVLSADLKDWRAFMFDVPRAAGANVSKLNDFWASLESLKDGWLQDDRYKGAYHQMTHNPHVLVFSNRPPSRHFMTGDRWRFWMIGPDKKLYKYDQLKAEKIEKRMEMHRLHNPKKVSDLDVQEEFPEDVDSVNLVD